MKSRIWILPSLVTLANLVCGFAAIGIATYSEINLEKALDWRGLDAFALAALFILAGLVFDALDGTIARMANLTSPFGAQLDSLCDMISFGLAPAYLVFLEALNKGLFQHDRYAWVCAALYILCSALRLARFNVQTGAETDDHRVFHGLPAPAAAGVLAAMILLDSSLRQTLSWPAALLPFVTVILAGLMVSSLRYVHLVNHVLRAHASFLHLVVIVLGVLAFLALAQYYEYILLVGFGLYALSGPAGSAHRRFGRARPGESAGENPQDVPERPGSPPGSGPEQ
ncbi:MAG: CDP-diacylglycerol--serine O-phosphatidyltransferase [Planctomycetota bacterium]